MEHQLSEWLGHFGYLGIFLALVGGIVGLPIPDELLMTFVGYTIATGRMEYMPALLCALFGSISGMTVNYVLGRKLGLPFLLKFGPKFGIRRKKIRYTQRLFYKFGAFLLFIGYFIPGARHLTPYLAGMARLPFRRFALYAYSGGLFWVFTFITLGWKMGKKWTVFEYYMGHYKPYLLLLGSLLILLVFVYFKFLRRASP
ncbi:DedA family protein [Aneurinibacillus sp. UBA3580]|jgi:membrane protein DedA with SNARE-associated domain|uniref:DedA family protein n=1 Tax=Aneurinibacillus sp. UBA3580 TaxID=1946041 RepID=UPI00257FD637|nr:DedA family protein [Aneurinibacillus sp. UBA3580]